MGSRHQAASSWAPFLPWPAMVWAKARESPPAARAGPSRRGDVVRETPWPCLHPRPPSSPSSSISQMSRVLTAGWVLF